MTGYTEGDYDTQDYPEPDGNVIRGLMWCGALYITAIGVATVGYALRHIWKLVAP